MNTVFIIMSDKYFPMPKELYAVFSTKEKAIAAMSRVPKFMRDSLKLQLYEYPVDPKQNDHPTRQPVYDADLQDPNPPSTMEDQSPPA